MTISQKNTRLLYQRSGNRCAFPGCTKVLDEPATGQDEAVPLSEVAHIVASKPDGPRGRHWLPIEERDEYDNLILLCEEHHHIIDAQPQTYTVERLRQFKADHEARMRDATGRAVEQQAEVATERESISETLYSTLLPVLEMPKHVYTAPCDYGDLQEKEAAQHIIPSSGLSEMYPFILRGGLLVCFHDLQDKVGPFRSLVQDQRGQVARYDSRSWWVDPNRERWFVQLLNRSLNKLTGRKGLNWDRRHNRYYFQPKVLGEPREISYRPMNRATESRQVVWQPVTKKTGLPKPYWLHRAVSLRFERIARLEWCLSLRPEFHVTRDGRLPFDSERIGSKVTRKKAKMYNYDLLGEVHFWRDFLSNSQPRIIFPFGPGQHIVVSSTMAQAQIDWPGIPEEFARPFKNVEYEDDLFSMADLMALEDEHVSSTDDSGDELDAQDLEDEELFA